jgi:hypothetical protein
MECGSNYGNCDAIDHIDAEAGASAASIGISFSITEDMAMKWRIWCSTHLLAAATAALALSTGTARANDSLASDVELASCDQPYGCVECGDCCDDCCDPCCSDCSSGCGLLGGLIKPTDCCYDSFISPMTNPTFFEDPRNLTELRGIFLQHKVPLTAAGGDIQLYALQFRAKLTERLSLIAPKDGYAVSTNPLIADGWGDVAMGLKYLVYADPQSQRLLSAGATYTAPWGSPRTQQALGDGDFHLFLTGGAQILDYGHVISAGGLRLPADDNLGSQMSYWSNHFDYEVFDRWYALTEFNWYHWIKSGAAGIPGIEGGDLFNLGSTGVAGNDIVTGAFGFKYKRSRHSELGVAWELPLTSRARRDRESFDGRRHSAVLRLPRQSAEVILAAGATARAPAAES